MIKVLNESGFSEAMLGLGLSYNVISLEDYKNRNFERVYDTALKLCGKGGGHDKFLESMNVTLYVEAPRYIWQEFDTYRVGITKQSESTMHTITKQKLTKYNFTNGDIIEYSNILNVLNELIELYKAEKDNDAKRQIFYNIKQILPESFLQRRVWSMSYKTLQNIVIQRKAHKLEEWKFFVSEILRQIEHPELIKKNRRDEKELQR
jgi:thymidylate synthase ThyX